MQDTQQSVSPQLALSLSDSPQIDRLAIGAGMSLALLSIVLGAHAIRLFRKL